MIDSVRSTVLAVLNKNNYGYLSPSDFNLYAKQAQLELFENLFYQYNTQMNLENARRSGTDYANISKGIIETIDLFEVDVALTAVGATSPGIFYLPSAATTAYDYYYINRIDCYISNTFKAEAEKISEGKINLILSSNLTSPSEDFPVYQTLGGANPDRLRVMPNTVYSAGGDVTCNYIRYPKDPIWTYSSVLAGQAPIFNPSATDYQDFELPKDYFNDLVIKILQYAGVEIREEMVYKFAKTEEQENNIEQQ